MRHAIITPIKDGGEKNLKILLILLFLRIIKLMTVISTNKKETDAATSASLQLNNQLILVSIILILFVLIIA